MAFSARLISAAFTAIPAFLVGAFTLFLFRGECFGATYVLVSIVFMGASVLIGLIFPSLQQGATSIGLGWGCSYREPWPGWLRF